MIDPISRRGSPRAPRGYLRLVERAVITPYENGPRMVRGPFVFADEDGPEIEVGRRTVALCRCGRSRLRPFCDGSHLPGNFTAEGGQSNGAARRHPVASAEGGQEG
jgi:CDGSH-type Zn-finger protein